MVNMKALRISEGNTKVLIALLEILFADDFKRVELETLSNGVIVTFSNIGKLNPLNFLVGKLINSEVPLLELFMRNVPDKLSEYATGNKSWAPVFLHKFALISRSNGDNLVTFLSDTMKSLQRPIDRNDYKYVKEEADKFGDPAKEDTIIKIIKGSSKLLGDQINLADVFVTVKQQE